MASYSGTSRQQVRNALRKAAKRKDYSKEVAAAQKRGIDPRVAKAQRARNYSTYPWPKQPKLTTRAMQALKRVATGKDARA